MKRWMLFSFLFSSNAIAQVGTDHLITLNLSGMTPHLGQMIKARLVEVPAGTQVAETTLVSLANTELKFVFSGESGKSYNLDYFADVDGDKVYSKPPADHAWRKSVPALHHQGATLTASHDVNFTDIQYPVGPSSILPDQAARGGKKQGKLGTRRVPSLVVATAHGNTFTLLGRTSAVEINSKIHSSLIGSLSP